jgi:hypothetical protein
MEGIVTVVVAQDDLHCIVFIGLLLLYYFPMSQMENCVLDLLIWGWGGMNDQHDVGLRLGRNLVIYVKAHFTLHGEFT